MTSFTPPPPSLTARCSARFYAASPAVMAGSSGGNGCNCPPTATSGAGHTDGPHFRRRSRYNAGPVAVDGG